MPPSVSFSRAKPSTQGFSRENAQLVNRMAAWLEWFSNQFSVDAPLEADDFRIRLADNMPIDFPSQLACDLTAEAGMDCWIKPAAGAAGGDHTCRLTAFNTSSIGSGASLTLDFTAAAKDTDSYFNAGSPTLITIPNAQAGDYAVFAVVAASGFPGSSPPTWGTGLTMTINGDQVAFGLDNSAGGTSATFTAVYYAEGTFAGGATLTCAVKNNLGNSVALGKVLFGVRKIDKAG